MNCAGTNVTSSADQPTASLTRDWPRRLRSQVASFHRGIIAPVQATSVFQYNLVLELFLHVSKHLTVLLWLYECLRVKWK